MEENRVRDDHGVWLDNRRIGELTRVRTRTQRIDESIRRAEVEETSGDAASFGVLVGWVSRLFH